MKTARALLIGRNAIPNYCLWTLAAQVQSVSIGKNSRNRGLIFTERAQIQNEDFL
jgi:hypothetical protein